MEAALANVSRETLVLLPGLLCDERLFTPQLPALPAVARPVMPDLTLDDSIGAMAERALAMAGTERFALAALSMGGYVALEIMRLAHRSGSLGWPCLTPKPVPTPRRPSPIAAG